MKIIDVSNPEWKLLGEFGLASSGHAEGVISAWLEEVLEPLNLSADLRTRILNSAEEALAPHQTRSKAEIGSSHRAEDLPRQAAEDVPHLAGRPYRSG